MQYFELFNGIDARDLRAGPEAVLSEKFPAFFPVGLCAEVFQRLKYNGLGKALHSTGFSADRPGVN